MPILGIISAAISGNLFAPSGAYDSIATVTVSTAVASVTFSSIPATYTHLQVRGISRNVSSGIDQLYIKTINGGGSTYADHYLYGQGSSVTSSGAFNGVQMSVAAVSGSTQTAGIFGAFVIDILDYANTNKYKTFRSLGGVDANGSGYVWYPSGLWQSTAAITSFTLAPSVNIDQYSSFALYGIKGA